MKHILATFVIAITATFGMSGVASAGNDYCGASANGCVHSNADTSCAGHGAFGGRDNNWAGGASGDNTAYSNSTLCGNPQGAAGVDAP